MRDGKEVIIDRYAVPQRHVQQVLTSGSVILGRRRLLIHLPLPSFPSFLLASIRPCPALPRFR